MNDMTSKTCCFTGHRDIPENIREKVTKKLKKELTVLIEAGYRFFGAGGALGFDTIAAQTVLELKKSCPDIKLILILPCLDQTNFWKENDKIIYEKIKGQADKIVYISKQYTSDCMFRRNRHLVDNSSACVCYLKKSSGGTAYTVKYAKEKNLKIINIADM